MIAIAGREVSYKRSRAFWLLECTIVKSHFMRVAHKMSSPSPLYLHNSNLMGGEILPQKYREWTSMVKNMDRSMTGNILSFHFAMMIGDALSLTRVKNMTVAVRRTGEMNVTS
jgi:hypothetical protein